MGLKSLLAIKEKYAQTPIRNKFLTGQEKRRIFRKKTKNKIKTGKLMNKYKGIKLEEIEFKYQQKLIFHQLKELTNLVKKLERRIGKIEKKL